MVPRIESLAASRRPPGCKKLKGGDNEWRIRVGDYRIVYEIDDTAKAVDVTRIAHRREAYMSKAPSHIIGGRSGPTNSDQGLNMRSMRASISSSSMNSPRFAAAIPLSTEAMNRACHPRE
jgi:hypothetical protein